MTEHTIIRDYAPGQFYTLGYISNKLGLHYEAVRVWERRGKIPPTQYRDACNRRLYTFPQVEAMILGYRLYKRGKLTFQQFTEHVAARWNG
jgi:hypothetical protein